MSALFFLFVLGVIGVIAYQFAKLMLLVGKVPAMPGPFTRIEPSASLRFLFMGDSTALGTGAVDKTQSVAGWFGQDFPEAHIENFSWNGRLGKELLTDFPSPAGHFKLVVVQIGGNDILRFTPLNEIEKNLPEIIRRAKMLGEHVAILHSGNVGLAPAFIWSFNVLYTERARKVREIYIRAARENGAMYVDLFTERGNDPFLKDVGGYYSPDFLHPSGQGYLLWYQRIRQTLDGFGVTLN